MKNSAAVHLEPLVEDLKRAVKKARRRGDTEDWHRLRTTSRRLRGALIAFGPLLEPERHAWLARRAKRITKLPTEVRDLDVAIENVVVLAHTRMKREQRAAKDMYDRLMRKRARRAKALQRQLRRRDPTAKLASVLRQAVRRGPGGREAPSPSPQALDACARAVLDRRAEVRGWRDDDTLHEVRVAVKKYRGALMALADATPESFAQGAALATLQRVQQVLGEHHDWSELGRRLIDQHAKLASRKGRPTEKLAGYRGLTARAAREQKARYEVYRRELHDRLPELVAVHAGERRLRSVPLTPAARPIESAGSP
jgi:CHAD domain-containing protein